MNRFFLLFFIIVFGISTIAIATQPLQCPDLNATTQWKLDKDTIKYGDQRWYISDFWYDEPTASGGELPIPSEPSDLVKAKSIKLIDQLTQGLCRYEVTFDDNRRSKLVIQRMGNP